MQVTPRPKCLDLPFHCNTNFIPAKYIWAVKEKKISKSNPKLLQSVLVISTYAFFNKNVNPKGDLFYKIFV